MANGNGWRPRESQSMETLMLTRIFRGFMVIAQGAAALLLVGLIKVGWQIRDDVREYNKSIPEMQRNIKSLMDNAITKTQLDEAEIRVKNKIIEEIRKSPKLVNP